MQQRCSWARKNKLDMEYHDKEWGAPVHDDHTLFELLILEGAQSGLSWSTILQKRDAYRKAFDNFDAVKVSAYDEHKVKELLQNPGIIRNKLKIDAAINNASAFIRIQQTFGSFDKYIWQFTHGKTICRPNNHLGLELSNAISKDLKRKGFKFVGPVICYAFMQAIGIVNDHMVDCYRYSELQQLSII